MTNKIEMLDFSKSFNFKHYHRTYCWKADLQKAVSDNNIVLENISRHHVQEYISKGFWTFVGYSEQSPVPTLLDRIKSFATLTGSSIFIQPDGEYEVYYDGANCGAKAKTDEEMKKLIDAIAVLHMATYGE